MRNATTTALETLLVALVFAVAGCGKPPQQAAPGTPAASREAVELAPAQAPAPAPTQIDVPEAEGRALALSLQPWTGDFDAMLERRIVRVLVPYSRTLYFNDKGQERGITADTVRDFERYINQKYRKDARPVTVVMIPTTRDKLLPGVADGLGDIAAGNITVTEARLELVDIVAPEEQRPKAELVVTGPKAPPLATLDDLAGKTVHVRPATSYYESITALSERLVAAGKAPIGIERLPDALEDEDVLEMLNAGLLDIVVVDDWRAEMWAQVLPAIKVHEDLKLRDDARVGWAVRKGSPQLRAAILDFYKQHLVKQGVAAYRLAQYMKRVKQIQDPTTTDDWRRFEQALQLFRKYGAEYSFDPLMLAAQGYQESRIDQGARSHVGAIGVMQIMPATGRELAVGDIRNIESNIHGGTKYLDQLMTRYFKDANFDEANRALFAFAAYNAGPGRIQQMRTLARERGLDPDVWFNNVEIVTAEKVGIETTTYVRNIFKYYAAYKLTTQAMEHQERARQQVAPPGG